MCLGPMLCALDLVIRSDSSLYGLAKKYGRGKADQKMLTDMLYEGRTPGNRNVAAAEGLFRRAEVDWPGCLRYLEHPIQFALLHRMDPMKISFPWAAKHGRLLSRAEYLYTLSNRRALRSRMNALAEVSDCFTRLEILALAVAVRRLKRKAELVDCALLPFATPLTSADFALFLELEPARTLRREILNLVRLRLDDHCVVESRAGIPWAEPIRYVSPYLAGWDETQIFCDFGLSRFAPQ